jgi:hypothetical protein
LAWGFWGGRLIAANGDQHDFHLGTWVAGMMATANEIANISSNTVATYTGHVAGVVSKGTSSYLAVGKFQTTWNFGSQNGTASVSQFDGANYSGAISDLGTGSENRFSGTLNSSSGRTGNLDGAFYRTHGKANGSVGGQIKFFKSASGYEAATTFAATQ